MQSQRIVLYTADLISASAIVGAIVGMLPALAALAGLLWYAVQIWESKTVQTWVRLHRRRKRLRCPSSRQSN